jgi:hypothetical protein
MFCLAQIAFQTKKKSMLKKQESVRKKSGGNVLNFKPVWTFLFMRS